MRQLPLRYAVRLVAIPLGMLFILAASSVLAAPPCEELVGCEQKACQIEQQLAIAELEGNKQRASGLKKALKANQKHCTNEGLRKDLLDDMAKSRQEMSESQAKLDEAKAEGKSHKVRKYQEKIKKSERRLNNLEQKLSELD